MSTIQKSWPVSIKVLKERRFEFTISTGAVDRDNDVINPKGWRLEHYRKNPVVLWAHDYFRPPIARTIDIRVVNDALRATAEFPPIGTSALADEVCNLLREGFLFSSSVGFRPLRKEYVTARGGFDIQEAELLEWSIVPVPANSEAVIQRCVGLSCSEPATRKWLSGICNCSEIDLAAIPYNQNSDIVFLLDEEVRVIAAGCVRATRTALRDMIHREVGRQIARARGRVVD